jgi:DNA-3-methyladenine glycosylase
VVAGLDRARQRAPRLADRDLARGPGRLARTLGVDGELTGSPVTGGGPLTVEPGRAVAGATVLAGPRVGVRAAHERPWRLWVAGDRTVSAVPGTRMTRASRPAAEGGRAVAESQESGAGPTGLGSVAGDRVAGSCGAPVAE